MSLEAACGCEEGNRAEGACADSETACTTVCPPNTRATTACVFTGVGTSLEAACGCSLGRISPSAPGDSIEGPAPSPSLRGPAEDEGSAAGSAGPTMESFPPKADSGPATGRCPRTDYMNVAWGDMSKAQCVGRATELGQSQCPFLSYSAGAEAQGRTDFCQCHRSCEGPAEHADGSGEWESFAAPFRHAANHAETSAANQEGSGRSPARLTRKGVALLGVLLIGYLVREAIDILPMPLAGLI